MDTHQECSRRRQGGESTLNFVQDYYRVKSPAIRTRRHFEMSGHRRKPSREAHRQTRYKYHAPKVRKFANTSLFTRPTLCKSSFSKNPRFSLPRAPPTLGKCPVEIQSQKQPFYMSPHSIHALHRFRRIECCVVCETGIYQNRL